MAHPWASCFFYFYKNHILTNCLQPENEEDEEDVYPAFKQIKEFQNGCRVSAMAWSPESAFRLREVADRLKYF